MAGLRNDFGHDDIGGHGILGIIRGYLLLQESDVIVSMADLRQDAGQPRRIDRCLGSDIDVGLEFIEGRLTSTTGDQKDH